MPENSYTSPRNSYQYQKLISIVQNHPAGGAELSSSLREMLRRLNAPGHLRFFGWVTEKLGRLIGHREVLQKALFKRPENIKHLDFSFLDQIECWVEWYRVHQEFITSQMGPDFELGPPDVTESNPLKKNPNPFQQKGLARYGLYAALVCIQEVKALEIRVHWELLALRFILTHEACYRAWSLEGYESFEGKVECPDILDKAYIPAKNLRILSNEECAPFLEKLTLEDIFNDKFQGGKRTDTEDEKAAGGYFNVLLGYMGRTEKGTRKHSSKKSFTRSDLVGRRHLFGQGYVEVDERRSALHSEIVDNDDPWSREPPLDLVEVIPNVDGLKPEELALIELYPPEFDDGDLLTLVEQDCGEREKNTGTAALAARARNKHLATQAQMFQWRYSTLTLRQFKQLNYKLRKELFFLNVSCQSDEQVQRAEVLLILLTMLWSGSDLERAISLSKLRRDIKSTDAQLGFYDRGEKADGVRYEWMFPSIEPKYQSSPQFDMAHIRPKTSLFWLPDVTEVIQFLSWYRESVQRDKSNNRLFLETKEKYELLLTTYLKELNQSPSGEGVTLKKISDFLFQHIVGETGDVTIAAHLTGKPHHLVNTSIFYTTPRLDYLRKIYKRAIKPILKLCNYNQSIVIAETKNSELSIGARHCVKRESYREAIQQIQEDLKNAEKYNNWEGFVYFHNLFTFYCVLMFGFASAARAIRNPLIKGSDIDVNGFSAFTDKDGEIPYHSRLIWLSDIVGSQLLEYERHLGVTTHWLRLKCPDKVFTNQVHPCYFIMGELNNSMQEVKPASLKRFYKKYIQVPVNAHRRFLRTELLEDGMPVEALDGFLGHWSLGQEPWGPYSTFNIPQYVEVLQSFLVPLMDKLGFEFVKSPLVLK